MNCFPFVLMCTLPYVFSFFLEKNMFAFFLNILRQKSGRYVCVQLLQTLNILFENISHETSLCKYLNQHWSEKREKVETMHIFKMSGCGVNNSSYTERCFFYVLQYYHFTSYCIILSRLELVFYLFNY